MAARWQQTLGVRFEAVLLCGDVGTFTEISQLDSATRRHARRNPCELEFLTQWSLSPPPRWLGRIFAPQKQGGLGLGCPVVMVHGNHEGFTHLARLVPGGWPADPVPPDDLPAVDGGGFIKYLPSGWTTMTVSGVTVAGIGGIEPGQRRARYHEMAYIDETAVLHLLGSAPVDVLITHQGPAAVQGDHGSELLQPLLGEQFARYWFHGHSTPHYDVVISGRTTVVPLADATFARDANTPELGGYCGLLPHCQPEIRREQPPFWRDFRRSKWTALPDGRLVCPPLVSPDLPTEAEESPGPLWL
jgi:hypothetical protein